MTGLKDRDSGGRASGKYNMLVTAAQLKQPFVFKMGSAAFASTKTFIGSLFGCGISEVIRVRGGGGGLMMCQVAST